MALRLLLGSNLMEQALAYSTCLPEITTRFIWSSYHDVRWIRGRKPFFHSLPTTATVLSRRVRVSSCGLTVHLLILILKDAFLYSTCCPLFSSWKTSPRILRL